MRASRAKVKASKDSKADPPRSSLSARLSRSIRRYGRRVCRVCHAPIESFTLFPTGTTRLSASPSPSIPRSRLLSDPASGLLFLLGTSPPRLHRLYCSPRCYTDPVSGHEERTKRGQRRRTARFQRRAGRARRMDLRSG